MAGVNIHDSNGERIDKENPLEIKVRELEELIGEKIENPEDFTLLERLKSIKETLQEVIQTIESATDASTDIGEASSGSQNTLTDNDKNWEVNDWNKAKLEIEIGDTHYIRTITENTEDTLTFNALPNEIEVTEGTEYQIKLPLSTVNVKNTSIQEDNETIQGTINSIDELHKILNEILVFGQPEDIVNSVRLYSPGYTKGAEITIDDTFENKVEIIEDNNDKFDLMIEATMPDGEEITIPSGTYENGEDFVNAIITGLENHIDPLQDYITVEWLGNDIGSIRFTSNDIGTQSYVYINEPENHSALVEMGLDNYNLVEEREGQAALKELLFELQAIFDNQVRTIGEEGNAWNNQSTGINGDSELVYLEQLSSVDIFGEVDGATNIYVYKSQDGIKFYDSDIVIEISEARDFSMNDLGINSQYIRLQSSNDVNITATIAAKA